MYHHNNVSSLWKEFNYVRNEKLIKSANIIEYDISRANITMLRKYGYLDDELYNYLSRLPKSDREEFIGKMIRDTDTDIYDIIRKGITEAKKQFFEQNQIQNDEVVRIANDAVYVNRPGPILNCQFDDVTFVPKHQYTTFLKLQNLLVFFYIGQNEFVDIDIIGMKEDTMVLHQEYLLSFIVQFLIQIERSPIDDVIGGFQEFYSDYLSLKLPVPYYREFNSQSYFKIKNSGWRLSYYDGDPKNLDIGYNVSILRDIYSALLELWEGGRRINYDFRSSSTTNL